MSEVEVAVYKGGQEIDRVVRPLRDGPSGPLVKYRRQLWPFADGLIDLDGAPEAEPPEEPSPLVTGKAPDGPDLAQQSVILAPAEARLLVDAGPGTGKTHAACHRVAELIRRGVPPGKIWLISFTRTAVAEIRARIAAAVDRAADAVTVKIATLDSHAWSLQSGFASDAELTGSFDENIERTALRIEEDEDLQDYLAGVRHLIVDEAQDIVGVRANLITAILRALDPECGVTVFADEAQAIYGFTEEETEDETPAQPLLPCLRASGFESCALTRVHRTDRAGLLRIFTDVRRRVLRPAVAPHARRTAVETEIRRLADDDAGALSDLRGDRLASDTFVLMRRRADVLEASSRLADTPHRLRMSGLPACVTPDIALLLWDHQDTRLSRGRFDQLWGERLAGLRDTGADEDLWARLVEAAGESRTAIDLHRLRDLLHRSSPPMLFCSAEFGLAGPVLGTIHASKGREAAQVDLYLSDGDNSKAPAARIDEETRVVFVGATRAREYLRLGSVQSHAAGSIDGRSWRWISSHKGLRRVKIEVGRPCDLTAAGLAGRPAFATPEAALAAQTAWAREPIRQKLCAISDAALGWNYALESQDKQRLAVLSEAFQRDMRELSRRCEHFPPPGFLPFLRSTGLRTIALQRDAPELAALHEPWRTSGIVLAPLLTGFSPATLYKG